MASASKARTRKSVGNGSGSDNAAGADGASSQVPANRLQQSGPRPVPAAKVSKPAAKRHTRRVAGEVLVPVPARKKNPPVRTAVARSIKRVPPPLPIVAAKDVPPVGRNTVTLFSDERAATPLQPWLGVLWRKLTGRLRAQLRRLTPRRMVLAQATRRYRQLLAEAELTHSIA